MSPATRFLLVASFLLPFFALAQEQEGDEETGTEKQHASIDSADTWRFYPNITGSYLLTKFTYPLAGFNAYDPARLPAHYFASLGNPGQASRQLLYRQQAEDGFSLRNDVYELYRLSLDSIRFIRGTTPYSDLFYMMGGSKEQKLDLTFGQQVKKGFFIGFNTRFAHAPGLYQRQRTYFAGVSVNARYLSPSGRYGVLAAYLSDRFKNQENGGLSNDRDFTANNEPNRRTVGVVLDNAINRNKSHGFLLQHYFNLQPSVVKTDSTGMTPQGKKFNSGRLVHTFRYSRSADAYQDDTPPEDYYPAVYNDSSFTYDSVCHLHFRNSLVYSNLEPDTSDKAFPFQYAFGIHHNLDKVTFTDTDTLSNTYSYGSIEPFGLLKGIIACKTYFTASARLALYGYYAGDHEIKGSFYQFLGERKNQNRIYLDIRKGQRQPEFMFSNYRSNHFRWDNDLKAQDYMEAGVGIRIWGGILEGKYSMVSNFTFLDEEIRPVQADDAVSILSASGTKTFRLGHWNLAANLVYQKIAGSSAISLPELMGSATMAYESGLFRNAVRINAGISVTWYSKYEADAYMPALRSFYRQTGEETGGYPYADVFLNLNVKRARFFVNYMHVNSGFPGYSYMITPHYPQQDRSLKFGVSWVFFD